MYIGVQKDGQLQVSIKLESLPSRVRCITATLALCSLANFCIWPTISWYFGTSESL